MNSQPVTTCRFAPVEANLRGWLDPIDPRAGSGALPPGVTPPAPQPQGPETHALNLELTLINDSQNPQTARVAEWNWSQGNQTHPATWSVQPDLSPLNRYSQIQRQLIQLKENQAVTAAVKLEINGQPCFLQIQIQPESR